MCEADHDFDLGRRLLVHGQNIHPSGESMTPSPNLVLVAAAVGLLVNTLAILAIAWRGGYHLGRMSSAVETLAREVGLLREATSAHARSLARLEGLEGTR